MDTRILSPTPAALAEAVALLHSGSLVAMPTETVYGLAGHAWDPVAVAAIFAAKERPHFDPLIVHVAADPRQDSLVYLEQDLGLVNLSALSAPLRAQIQHLLQVFWPGPLTCVLPKALAVPDLVTSGLATVAVRMPAHPVAQALLQTAGIPLAAPSANRFGRISPTTAEAVWQELNGRIPLILQGGSCQVGLESTVIAPTATPDGDVIYLLRPGGIPVEVLQQHTHLPIIKMPPGSLSSPQAPGQLKSHYAPGKPLLLLPTPIEQLSVQLFEQIVRPFWTEWQMGLGLLRFAGDPVAPTWLTEQGIPVQVAVLSPSGDLTEAAQTLFARLRELDQGSTGLLISEPCPGTTGLGYAITDRLQRAAVS
ncbi:MAG: threonylcarbamoyl-AMP synthase [Synechococcaceae cyanobacterium SM2_3_2]|nr:threonylcarbamoyl-AMP synthase [Synechococcaceae cyanobacterium SM2_3_2]